MQYIGWSCSFLGWWSVFSLKKIFKWSRDDIVFATGLTTFSLNKWRMRNKSKFIMYWLLAYWVFKLRYCFWEECLDRNREGTSCITWYLWRISYSADWFTSFYNYACIHSLKMSDKKFGKKLHQLWHVTVYMFIFTNYVFYRQFFKK